MKVCMITCWYKLRAAANYAYNLINLLKKMPNLKTMDPIFLTYCLIAMEIVHPMQTRLDIHGTNTIKQEITWRLMNLKTH